MNNIVKRVLCTVIAIIIVTSTITVYANNLHWAQESIDYLLEKGIISGDSKGVRPDDSIKRSEYAKIINRLFGFEKASAEEFEDVAKDAWYYRDMHIAKEAGYFVGDGNGKANPESYLTRAEACVVYARLLKLDTTSKASDFEDASEIASWAKGAVSALNATQIIRGYSDNKFRPQKLMTRAEVFATSVRVVEYKKEEQAFPLNTYTGTVKPSSGSGGGGGGGGGGSSAVIPQNQTTSFVRVNTETAEFFWNRINGASTFNIKIIRTTNGLNTEEVITLSDTSVNLKEKIDSITASGRCVSETFKIAVKSNLESVYSPWYELEYKYPSISVPDDLRSVSESDDDGEERVYIKWTVDSNANGYELSVKFGDDYVALPYVVSGNEAIAEVPSQYVDGLKEKYALKFKGISGNPDILDSEYQTADFAMPLFESGKGTISEPYVISNYRHFRNIKEKTVPGTEFLLVKDIVLPAEYIPFEFSGNIRGDETEPESLRKITISLDTTNECVGLFSKITSGSVSNLKLEGYVRGKASVGSFAGEANASILNCINNAEISGSGDYVGGFAGKLTGGSVENSLNYGDVNGGRYTGGIVGMHSSGTEKNCGNAGNITATGNFSGGIVGYSYNGLENCFNSGNVKGSSGVGGITGYFTGRNTSIKNSYNTGKIEAVANGSENVVGGIIGTINASAKDARNIEIINCYNTGNVISPADIFSPIYPDYTPAHSDIWIRATDCYYLSENNSDDGKENTTPYTSSQLEGLVFEKDGVLLVNPDTLYPYPELPSLPHVQKAIKLAIPAVVSVVKNDDSVSVMIKGDENSASYTVCVYNDEEHNEKAGEITSASGGMSQSVDITSLISEYKYYYLTVKANSGSIFYDNSDILSYTYHHKAAALPDPMFTGDVMWNSDSGYEKYVIEWEEITASFLTGYKIEISDGNSVVREEIIAKTSTSYEISENSGITFGGDLTFSIKAVGQVAEQDSGKVSVNFNTQYAGGDGTENSPYIVMNERHFNNIRNNINSVYSVENDIDLTISDVNYEPFALDKTIISGSVTDNMRTITVNIDKPQGNGVGLFTSMTSGAKISNLRLAGDVKGYTNVGGFVGTLSAGTVSNCLNEATVFAQYNNVGGIAGTSNSGNSVVENCINKGAVSGNAQTGGIIGYARGRIATSANLSDVTGGGTNVGGIIGSSSTGTVISECYNAGAILTKKNGGVAGGIAGGVTSGSLTVNNCYNTANVKSAFRAGTAGIVGGGAAIINYSYNAVISADIINPLCPATVTATGCYYMSVASDDVTGALTAEQMQDLSNFAGFDHTIWFADSLSEYLYPQLINNIHTK